MITTMNAYKAYNDLSTFGLWNIIRNTPYLTSLGSVTVVLYFEILDDTTLFCGFYDVALER